MVYDEERRNYRGRINIYFKVYHDSGIIHLSKMMSRQDIPVTELNVIRFVGTEV